MARPRRKGISAKVVFSFVSVVLFQGIISIVVVTWILSGTAHSSLDDQIERTGIAIERRFNEEAKSMLVKANLLSGQEKLIDYIATDNRDGLRSVLIESLSPLKLDAAIVLSGDLKVLSVAGNRDAVDIALKNGIVLSYNTANPVILTGDGSKMQMWGMYPVYRGDVQVGILCAGINLNRLFISGLEEAANTEMILSLRKTIMVNGHLSDPIFINYIRRAFDDPGQAEFGTIDNLVYRMVRFTTYKDLSAVFFIDTTPSQNVLWQYNTFSILFLILVLVLAFTIAILLYRISFQKPFASFQQAVRSISGGQLTFSAQRPPDDEFGELEREFEQMTVNLKKLEEKLQISSRMAAVGEMVAGVAHQIRNPLGIMKVSAGMLSEAFNAGNDPDGRYRKLVSVVSGEIDSLGAIISNFLDFTRPLHVNKEETDIGAMIDHTLNMIPKEKFRELTVRTEVRTESPYPLDRTLIQHALSNLLINAFEVSSPGQEVVVGANLQEDGRLCLRVSDQGSGIQEDAQKQIFNPFFTTKRSGTGLGLSIVHRIVESHGGQIEFESKLQQGTNFRLVL